MSNVKFISDDMIIFNESLNEQLQTLVLSFSKIRDLNLKKKQNVSLDEI